MKPGMEWADSVSLTGCRYHGCNFSIKPWPGVVREEPSPAAFPSHNSGRCGVDPAEDHQQRAVLLCLPWNKSSPASWSHLGYSGKLQNLTPIPTPLLLCRAGGSAQPWAETVSASKHSHFKKLQRRVGWTGKIRILPLWHADIPDKIHL